LFGWTCHLPALLRVFPEIGPDEAFGLVLSGAALFFLHNRASKRGILVARGCAIVLVCFICASQSFFRCDLSLLQLLPHPQDSHVGAFQPHLVALQIGISLTLIAAGILCASLKQARFANLSQLLALIVLVLALASALNQIYGFQLFKGLPHLLNVPFSSAFMLMAMAVALFLSRPDCGAAALCSSDSAGEYWLVDCCPQSY
jgi:hypothetical protein